MPSIGSHTSTEKVRGALGVTAREISDNQLDDLILSTRLDQDLMQWIPDHSTLLYTSEQETSMTLYCTAFCALEVCKRMALLSAQRVSDGKSEVERQPVDFMQLANVLREDMRLARAYLETSGITAVVTAITPFNPFMGVAAGYNPVTNV